MRAAFPKIHAQLCGIKHIGAAALRILQIRGTVLEMRERKIFGGERLARARARRGLKQAEAAKLTGISASYYNQLEKNHRPITPALLAKIAAAFNITDTYFVDSEDVRRAGALREALADPLFRARPISTDTIAALVRAAPEVSDAFMTLYRNFLLQKESQALPRAGPEFSANFAYDEVRDWVQSRQNHFDTIDRAAENLFETARFGPASLIDDLKRYLRDQHGITVDHTPGILAQGIFWRLNRGAKRLYLAQEASVESETFWIAHVIGQIECKALIEREIRRAAFSSEEAQGLARIGLANYFAGALMMPYRAFHESAQILRHDLQRLQRAFGAGFEQVCHRLSTLQRPNLAGIPFHFAKIDIAGNILKRSSASRFAFAQFGGPCPLWNVFRAFAHPGEILVQRAVSPDGAAYLNIARTVGRGGGSYLSRPRAVAVVLGCEARYAGQMVYAEGLDLTNPDLADPIGPGCRACERTNCRHRAVPPMNQALDLGTAERGVVPYRIKVEGR
jgi:predicted transcriptional regulator/transcriptional regulator with XRE-family HTH domain